MTWVFGRTLVTFWNSSTYKKVCNRKTDWQTQTFWTPQFNNLERKQFLFVIIPCIGFKVVLQYLKYVWQQSVDLTTFLAVISNTNLFTRNSFSFPLEIDMEDIFYCCEQHNCPSLGHKHWTSGPMFTKLSEPSSRSRSILEIHFFSKVTTLKV